MTKEREALKLVQKKLVAATHHEAHQRAKEMLAIEALQLVTEALALPEQEPFGYFKPEPFGWTDCAETDEGAIALYDMPQRKEPEQEPVAIMREMLEVQGQHGNWNYDPYMHGLYNGMEYMVALAEKRGPQFRDAPETWLAKYEIKRNNFNSTEPLTETTQPQRKPLTDEQIDALREKNSEGRGAGWRFNFNGFARAIEAAHGIKE